ncbi:MAG: PepSY domain-containing protein [Bacteroidota bacterium]
MKKLHKWPSLFIAVFILLWAVSGIILNHRHTFSSCDVNRELLPAEYHYKNWNNAAIRGSVPIDSSKVLFYGNAGVWQFNNKDEQWTDLRKGLPPGADHHKINCLLQTKNKQLFAGTRFGLYYFNQTDSSWLARHIPHHDQHVVDLLETDDSLLVMTRSHLWKISLEEESAFNYVKIQAPKGYDNKVGLFKTLWVIHSGEIYGLAGKLLVDAIAVIFIFLTLTGLIYFFFPRITRRRKKKGKKVRRLVSWSRWSFKWHHKFGIWVAIILIVSPLTGIFLRPPLLIAIASGRVEKIPYSSLDDGNPWHDQLRRIIYYEEHGSILLATSEGIFGTDPGFKEAPEYITPQPPASVMGYNVFTEHDSGDILVGSFSGIYTWNYNEGNIRDYLTGQTYIKPQGAVNPISKNLISGFYVDADGHEYLFDYNRGAISHDHAGAFPAMPEEISEVRMPLWNVAQEMHTARLFKPFLGDFYILFIPLFGLSALLILISGVILWIRKYNRSH